MRRKRIYKRKLPAAIKALTVSARNGGTGSGTAAHNKLNPSKPSPATFGTHPILWGTAPVLSAHVDIKPEVYEEAIKESGRQKLLHYNGIYSVMHPWLDSTVE